MSTSEGPRCDVSIEGRVTNRIPWGGGHRGEARTNIVSAPRCNKTLYSNNNSDQYFQIDMYKI